MVKIKSYKVLFKRNYKRLLPCVEYPSNTSQEEQKIVQSILLSLAHFIGLDVQLIAHKTGRNENEILSLLQGCKFRKEGKEPSPLFRISRPLLKPTLAMVNFTSNVHDYLTGSDKRE